MVHRVHVLCLSANDVLHFCLILQHFIIFIFKVLFQYNFEVLSKVIINFLSTLGIVHTCVLIFQKKIIRTPKIVVRDPTHCLCFYSLLLVVF